MSWLNDRLDSLNPERRKYIISQLANHLAASNQQDRLRQLFTSLDYLLIKILVFKTKSLIDELNLPASRNLKLFSQINPYSSLYLNLNLENEAIDYLDKILLQNKHLLDRCESLNDVASTLLCHSSYAPSLYKILSNQELPKPILLPAHPLSDNNPPALTCTLEGHTQKINSCAINANGSIAVSASDDNTLKIWDTNSGVEIRTLNGHTKEVKFCSIDALGNKIVSTALDGSLKVWDVQKGTAIISKENIVPGAPCSISADSTIFASIIKVGSSKKQNLVIWNIDSNAIILTIHQPHNQKITSCTINSDGTIIVTTSLDGSVKVWDAKSGKELRRFKHRKFGRSPIQHCAITASGRSVISVGDDQKVHVWENLNGYGTDYDLSKTSTELHLRVSNMWGVKDKLSGEKQDATIYSYGMSYDGATQVLPLRYTTEWTKSIGIKKSVFMGANQQHALVITHNKDTKVISSGHVDRISDCKVSGDGSTVISASADCTLKIWNVRKLLSTPYLEYPIPHFVGSMDANDNQDILITGSTEGGIITIWDSKTNKPQVNIPAADIVAPLGNGSVIDCAISGDGKKIVTLVRHTLFENPSLRFWANNNNKFRFWSSDDLDAKYNCCAIVPNGQQFIAGAENGTLIIGPVSDFWNGAGEEPVKLAAHNAPIMDCAINHQQSLIASASSDQTIKIWDFATLSLKKTLVGHNDKVIKCSINADGSKIVSASADHKLILWDLVTGNHVVFDGHKDSIVDCSISPDGNYIVSASKDQSIIVWNSETGKRLVTLYLDDKRLSSCIYSSDGKSIIAGGYWGLYFLRLEVGRLDFPTSTKESVDVAYISNVLSHENATSVPSNLSPEKPLLKFIEIDEHKRTHFFWTSIPKAVEYIFYQDSDPYFFLPWTKQRLNSNTTQWIRFSVPETGKKQYYCVEAVTDSRASVWSNVLCIIVNDTGIININSYKPPSGWRAKPFIAAILELIPGMLGFSGIGWLYSKNYSTGIILMLATLVLFCISLSFGFIAGLSSFEKMWVNLFCLAEAIHIIVAFFSYMRLWRYLLKKNQEVFLN